MPLYDYKCQECGRSFEQMKRVANRHHAECKCGAMAEKQVSKLGGHMTRFEPGWFEHFGPEPRFIQSEKELEEVERETGREIVGPKAKGLDRRPQ